MLFCLAHITAFSAAILISCHAKALIFYLAFSQDEKPYQTKNLQKGESSDVIIITLLYTELKKLPLIYIEAVY